MSNLTLRELYDAFQQFYDKVGSGFTPEHPVFKRGAVMVASNPMAGAYQYHVTSGCIDAPDPAHEAPFRVLADDLDWGNVCYSCVVSFRPPLKGAADKLLTPAQRLLAAVEAAGGVVTTSPDGVFADLRELLTREKFPLPAAQHPRDWYDFWEAFNQFSITLRTSFGSRSADLFGDAGEAWVEDFNTEARTALERWARSREVFTNLMYARARYAMTSHVTFRRQGEIKLKLARTDWPYTPPTVETVELADPRSVSREYLAGAEVGDYETVGEQRDAEDIYLRRLALEQLYTVTDAELDTLWEGEDTPLVWNQNRAGSEFNVRTQRPLGGWFFPAFVIPQGVGEADLVPLGTVADAFATGGLDGFSTLRDTAAAIKMDFTISAMDLRAARATLERSAGS